MDISVAFSEAHFNSLIESSNLPVLARSWPRCKDALPA